ncbi:MAG: molybdopterin molybdotransferase MoeA [Armatimonadetes bacterium]|nr:molybdopterin molybdotransferase MoeA [Armatimonadota bacterium]
MAGPDEARTRYAAVLRPGPRGTERVPLRAALGRVMAEDAVASTDLPPFDRSTMDGWAVRASDLAAAAPGRPVFLRPSGEVHMGVAADVPVPPCGAVRISTGGMLPVGADAVVMQEQATVEAEGLLVSRPVIAGENVVARGADIRAGELVLRRGWRLRPPDLGLLAGQGLESVLVFLPPRVAILATGDELVPAGAPLTPGRVRDMNTVALAGAVDAAGGVPTICGIVGDDRPAILAALRSALAGHDMLLVSGGSSVGEHDLAMEAIAALGPPGIVVHGIAVRPGKPTVLAAAGTVPVIGLPGNPVSALVIFDLFARPVLEAMLGLDPGSRPWGLVRARLFEALPSARVREDHRRVRLEQRPGGIWAVPLPAGSQILTSMVRADGIVVVPPGEQGLGEGEEVEVRLLT